MGKAVSSDLRPRMVRGIAAGKSRRGVAAQFEVAPSTAIRIRARWVGDARWNRPNPVRRIEPVAHRGIGPVELRLRVGSARRPSRKLN